MLLSSKLTGMLSEQQQILQRDLMYSAARVSISVCSLNQAQLPDLVIGCQGQKLELGAGVAAAA